MNCIRERWSKEERKKYSERMKNKWKNPEYKKLVSKKLSEKIKKYWENSENKKKRSEQNKLIWSRPKNRKQRSLQAKKRWESAEHKEQLSNIAKKRWENPEYRNNISGKIRKGKQTEENRKRQSEISTQNWKNPEVRKKIINTMKLKWQSSEKYKQRKIDMSKRMKKQWGNKEFKNKIVEASRLGNIIKPNVCEQSLYQILNELFPDAWKYTGGGENVVVLGGFVPDFMNCNGKKLLVEFDGDYWHSSEKVKEKDQRKLAKYKELGFDTLVIKENEFKNDKEDVKNRIVEFVKNYEKEHYGLLV